jgi:ELWxxDGT repeat protein
VINIGWPHPLPSRSTGDELWKSDGTPSGTVRVLDIRPNADGSAARYLTNVNGTLYFRADDGSTGYELWKSDGTESGTVRVLDIQSGTLGSTARYLTNVNGTLFFRANDGSTGYELWKSDGTSSGTVQVRDIQSVTLGSSPRNLTNVNGTLYFQANDGSTGVELWKSDGTSSGTVRVLDIQSVGLGSNPYFLTNVNGTLYFSANDGSTGYEVWKSDGTSSGTVRVLDIWSGNRSSGPRNLTNVNGTLYFRANDGSTGSELWKSDGTSSGTVRVLDIRPGANDSNPYFLTNVNGTLYFQATDGSTGYELWKSDGTESGTVRVLDIQSVGLGSNPSYLTNVNGTLYFRANDGSTGVELWKSDGTESGTVRVLDIRPGDGSSNSNPSNLTNVNGTLYFVANDGSTGDELWRSDGTSSGTVRVRDIQSGSLGSNPNNLTNVNGTLYFRANDGSTGFELWQSDGTESGTVRVRDIRPGDGSSNSNPSNLTNVNGTLYFVADDGSTGVELWQSDGTSSGTVLAMDVVPGARPSSPSNLTAVGDRLFFTANTPEIGEEVWQFLLNVAPTNISLSPISIAENQASGSAVGDFSTIDPDAGNTFTYTLVSGDGSTDNASFTIGGTNGNSLLTTANFDFETKSSHSIRVRSTDQGGLWFEKQFTITVTNVNEAPTNLTLSATSIAENQPIGTQVGVLSGTDPDAGTTFTYTLVSGEGSGDNASFTIGGTSGNSLLTAASFDFETKSSYSIRVRVSDGSLSFEKQFTISVTNVNEAPTNLTLSATSIAENQASGTAVGSFTTIDPDASNTFTYTLVSGTGSTDNGSFTINGNTLKTAASFDYETKSSYSIRVRSTDQGGLWTEKQFPISVTDVNEGATQVVLSNVVTSLLATANTTSAIRLADVSFVDDGLGTNTYSLSGPDASTFELVSGQLRLKAGTVLNYDTKKTYSVTVNVDDTTVGGTPDASVDYTLSLQGFDGITVQNGSAGRSYVRYVTLTFGTSQGLADAVASMSTPTPRIRLLWGAASGKVWTPRTLTSSMVSTSGNQLLFDFGPQGVGGVANSAVGDGLYRLRVDLDGSVDSTGKRLSEVVANFFRLFGDADGNGLVNQADVTAVTQAQGLPGLYPGADLDGDGDVDADDLNNVKKRLGARVWFVA